MKGPRITVGLEYNEKPAVPAEPGSGQRSPNLCRMVAVVIDNRDPAFFPARLEAAVDTGKRGETRADFVRGNL